ncbi:MAG: ABC-type transport auxiliary lipoprotein family protein [Gammaproteobacteria bacterium]|nr:ABC-type transport auxiliary lipoprotein family protein [Gammaproteobacteria bacterium]
MKAVYYAGVVFLSLNLGACSFGPVEEAHSNTYMLTDISMQIPVAHPQAATLMVMPVTAVRGFDSTAMRYQMRPYQLSSFAQNMWMAPPANMISPLLLKSLQNSHLFQAVVSGPSMNNTTYTLNAKLLALYQDFTVKPSQMVLSLELSFGNNQNNQLVADQVMTVRVNTAAETPYAGVQAANQALSQSLGYVTQFVSLALMQSAGSAL